MRLFADSWLKEARHGISSCRTIIEADPPGRADLRKLADATEKAIKAALIESNGTIPQRYEDYQLVATCQKTGLWDVLPPTLKSFVQEVEPYNRGDAGDSNTNLTYAAPFEKYFCMAPMFVDYIEQHVIGNHSVLKRLTVA
ncbi:MAG: hypothetical protein ACREQ7_24195 [Candidatus Binatia bacterium]